MLSISGLVPKGTYPSKKSFTHVPADVEEMIRMRLKEQSWSEESGKKEEMWPREFFWVSNYGQEV